MGHFKRGRFVEFPIFIYIIYILLFRIRAPCKEQRTLYLCSHHKIKSKSLTILCTDLSLEKKAGNKVQAENKIVA